MEDRSLNYLALARKGGMLEVGEEPVGAVARAGKAHLVVVASDASDHTWRRALSFVAGTDQQCIRLAATKEQLGFVVGRQSLAIAAVTDPRLALAFLQSLNQGERYRQALEALTGKADRARKHQAEARAHQRNLRKGKK